MAIQAWQTRPPTPLGKRVAGGRIWRYDLEPTDGGTRVRESWDISQEKVKAIVRPARKRTRLAMADTLERIEALVTATSSDSEQREAAVDGEHLPVT